MDNPQDEIFKKLANVQTVDESDDVLRAQFSSALRNPNMRAILLHILSFCHVFGDGSNVRTQGARDVGEKILRASTSYDYEAGVTLITELAKQEFASDGSGN